MPETKYLISGQAVRVMTAYYQTEIQLEQTGLKVSNLYIAQIKKKCGLDVGENFNLPKSENAKQPKCTPEKEEAIIQAFVIFLKNIVYNETNMTHRCRVVGVRIYQEVKAI